MRTDTTVSAFRHPDAIEDPLTSVLRDGARRLLAEAIEAEAEVFPAAMQRSGFLMAGLVLSATAMARSEPSRRASARCRFSERRFATAAAMLVTGPAQAATASR